MIALKKLIIALLFLVCLFPITPLHDMVSVSAKQSEAKLSQLANDLSRKPDDPPYLSFYYRYRKFCFSTEIPHEKSIVFLGDSITDEGDWAELFPAATVKNRGIGGDTTLGVLNRLDQVVSMKPAKVFLMIGTNDLCYGRSISDTAANYKKIVKRLQTETPTTTIYVESVLPFNETLFPSRGLRTNENIQLLNLQIRKLAKEQGLEYIDLVPAFSDRDFRLVAEYTSDGLHLNKQGYLTWRDQIKKLVL